MDPADWHQAAQRALAALGGQWRTHSPAAGRAWLVACLRQGLCLARDHHLDDLVWLTDAAHAYMDDSVWEPIAPPAPTQGDGQAADTPADALAELLTAISRRRHEHRAHTAERLSTALDSGLLSDEPRSTSPACPGSSHCWRPPSPSTTPSAAPRTI
ncbi:hypothetical protein [Kitasatospora aureofaciens]|uniref:hypothetical protein n=1 Tax=Kitasatospora aureofaciens TaxID=1894 RepID=UPI0036F4585F